MFCDIIKRIKLLFDKDRQLYLFFYSILGYYPDNISIYIEALTHRSALCKNEAGDIVNNERLEFLGDGVLDSVVADLLYTRFPDKQEGFLSSVRSRIVQREHLNKVGANLGLANVMRSGNKVHFHNSYILGNAVEAFVGAIYLDKGYRAAARFIKQKVIDKELETFATEEVNYKSKLIEWAQKYKVSIDYELISTSVDADNSPCFRSAVLLEGVYVAEGSGYTKKESHQNASKKALSMIGSDVALRNRILTHG